LVVVITPGSRSFEIDDNNAGKWSASFFYDFQLKGSCKDEHVKALWALASKQQQL
jgi:hypothetical protein